MLDKQEFDKFRYEVLSDVSQYPVHQDIGAVDIAGYQSHVLYDSDAESLYVDKAGLNIPLKNGPCALLNLNYEQFNYILATNLAEQGILTEEQSYPYELSIPTVTVTLDTEDFTDLGMYPTSDAEENIDTIRYAIDVAGTHLARGERLKALPPEQRVTAVLQELTKEMAANGLTLPEIGKAIQKGTKVAIQEISAKNIEQKMSR